MYASRITQLEDFESYIESDHLYNFDNYWIYGDMVRTNSSCIINAADITNENLDNHFFAILNIFQDGIETEDKVQQMFVVVNFTDGETAKLSLFHYFYNLIFWKLPLECGDPITSEFLFFPEDLTTGFIKDYIDNKYIGKHLDDFDIIRLNNIIDDCIYKFAYIDKFHQYLLNTIDNESTIQLMNENKEFYDCIHSDLSKTPIDKVKDVGMEIANKAISIIKKSTHCLRDAFRTGQGINPRQYKEFTIHEGTKPDGNGGIYPHVINSSFANGGLRCEEDFVVDSGAARTAQILSKENVGDAGRFSRILGLNNESSRLHDDPNYICRTQNLMKVTIKNKKILNMYKNRWYRTVPYGIERKLSINPLRDNKDLIGKTLYFRSPITCASAARGLGICHRCYGGLSRVNYSLSAGKIAAEILCSILTQMLLSSKHLLESMVMALKWVKEFHDVMCISANLITINDNLENLNNYYIEFSNVTVDNEHEQFDYNAYITSFDVIYPDGHRVNMHTENYDNIYLSNSLLDKLGDIDINQELDMCTISFDQLQNIGVFMVKLVNSEISRTLDRIINLIKTSNGINGRPKEKVLEELVDAVIDGKVNVDAIHLEVLLSNQIRKSAQDILDMPEWEYPNAQYYMISLNKALTDHPSVTVSLQYEKQSKALYYPLNYKKQKSNSVDLFYMTQPHMLENIPELNPSKPRRLFEHIDNKEE